MNTPETPEGCAVLASGKIVLVVQFHAVLCRTEEAHLLGSCCVGGFDRLEESVWICEFLLGAPDRGRENIKSSDAILDANRSTEW